MKVDKIIKWHETKSISIANDICDDLYDDIMHFCIETDTDISEVEEITPIIINRI